MSLSGIYDGLDEFDAQQQNIELIKCQQEQNDKIQRLENDLNILQKRVSVLEKENHTLSRNISRLFMTAKREIRQKEARIAELERNMPVAVEKLHCGTQTSEEGELAPLKPITIQNNIIPKCSKDVGSQYNAGRAPDPLSNFIAKHSQRSNSRESENKHRSRKLHKSRSHDKSSRHTKKRKRSRSRSRSRSRHRHRKSQSKKRKRTRSRSRSRPRKRSTSLPKCKEPSPISNADRYVELDPISLCDKEFEELCTNILETDEIKGLNATGAMHVDESPNVTNVKSTPDAHKSINVEESPKKASVSNPDPHKSVNLQELPKDPNVINPPYLHKEINVEESPMKANVSNPDPQKKILIENANNDIQPMDLGPNENVQVKQLINQMFVLMNSLQQQFQEQKELFNSMKQNTDKETAKTRLKFDQNSKNNIIFDESKREITILKPTTIKFEAATSESVLDNYYQQDQQPHGYKTTMVCPRTPPPSNNFIHHDRYTAVVSTPKKKPKTPTALDKQIKNQIKNLIPNRTSIPINNSISDNSKVFQEVGKHEKINILQPRRWKRNVTATTSTPVATSTKTPPVFHLNLSNLFNGSAKAFKTPEKTMTLSQLITKSPSMKNAAALSATIFDDNNPVNDKETVSHNIDAILKSMEQGNNQHLGVQDYTVNSLFDVLTKMTKTTPPQSPTTVPSLPLPEINKDAHLEISRKSLTDNNVDLEDGVIVDNILLDKDASFKSLIDVMENSNMDVLQYYEEKMRKAEEEVVKKKITEPVEVQRNTINDKVCTNIDNEKPKHSVCDRDMPKIFGMDDSCDNITKECDKDKKEDNVVEERLMNDESDKKRVIIKKDETITVKKTRSMTVSDRVMQAPMKPRRLSNIIDLDLTDDGNSFEHRSTPIKSAPVKINKPKVRRAAKDHNLEKLKRIQKYILYSISNTAL